MDTRPRISNRAGDDSWVAPDTSKVKRPLASPICGFKKSGAKAGDGQRRQHHSQEGASGKLLERRRINSVYSMRIILHASHTHEDGHKRCMSNELSCLALHPEEIGRRVRGSTIHDG